MNSQEIKNKFNKMFDSCYVCGKALIGRKYVKLVPSKRHPKGLLRCIDCYVGSPKWIKNSIKSEFYKYYIGENCEGNKYKDR